MCSLEIPKVSKLYIWHSSLDVWCLTKKRTIQSRCALSIDKERKEGFTAFSQKDSQLRPNNFKFAFWFPNIWLSITFNKKPRFFLPFPGYKLPSAIKVPWFLPVNISRMDLSKNISNATLTYVWPHSGLWAYKVLVKQ